MTTAEERIMGLVEGCYYAVNMSKTSEAHINVIPVIGLITSEIVAKVIEELKQNGFEHISQIPKDDGSITISFTSPQGEP